MVAHDPLHGSGWRACTTRRCNPLPARIWPTGPPFPSCASIAYSKLRSYGFSLDGITFDQAGLLPLDIDPKTLWAQRHPERFPVEVNRATREELLRVPGIGPRSAKRLVAMRREQRWRDVEALRATGASWRMASPYLLLDGQPAERQLRLC